MFAAVQAAQKKVGRVNAALSPFAAVQAAQKFILSPKSVRNMFAAVQAAQKRDGRIKREV